MIVRPAHLKEGEEDDRDRNNIARDMVVLFAHTNVVLRRHK